MAALDSSLNLYYAEREVFLSQPKDANSIGDFSGVVKAEWVKLNDNGLGIVLYKGKRYKARPLGKKSIAAGTFVALSFANGIYFVDW